MHLTAEQFAQVIERARREGHLRVPEKRKAKRVSLAATVLILPMCGKVPDEPMTAYIRDISSGSIAIITPSPLHSGCQFFVRLPREAGKPLWVQCEVARWRPVAEGSFLVGAKFCRLIDLAQVPVRPAAQSRKATGRSAPSRPAGKSSGVMAWKAARPSHSLAS